MSIEQRILFLAESPDCNHPRELRAIALEVRKREDRIKQLEEMYEGIPGERPDLLGTNVMGLLKRELTGTQKRIKHLEDIINRAHLAFFSDSSDRKVSIAMHRILDEEVRKEAKP